MNTIDEQYCDRCRPLEEENVIRRFEGTEIENQRIRVTTERWSQFCGDFVHVFQRGGDDSIDDMVFTDTEARFLLSVLNKIYSDDPPKEREP